MGKSFYDEFAIFRQTVEESSDALSFNLKKLCFDGPAEILTLTENAQPAILTVSVGCERVARETLGIEPSVNLGHSLGEYSALVSCGALTFTDAVRWVRARGLAMQEAVPAGEGTMSAILGAEDAQISEWCKEAIARALELRKISKETFAVACTVEVANFNAPGQVVVSGSVDAVEALENLIKEKAIRGVMAKRLTVSAPFHCSLMKPARTAMEKIFKTGSLNRLSIPYIPNRTARITAERSVIFELLSEQVDNAVLWKQSVETLLGSDYSKAYEFGPGKVLQGLGKRIAKGIGKEFEVIPIFDLESLKTAEGTQKDKQK